MHTESLAAYNYYDALKKISTNEIMLSQSQPGFYAGNIQNLSAPKEKIIGFFDISHVSSKRIFFNFEDFFPTHAKPKYPYSCPEVTPENKDKFVYRYCFCYDCLPVAGRGCNGNYILDAVYSRVKCVHLWADEDVTLVNIQCGDCTSFSSNVRPPFWID